MGEALDEEHPVVLAVKQAVSNHGWLIETTNAVELVQAIRRAVAQYSQKMVSLPDGQQKSIRFEAERVVRELAPEYLETPEGDKPEIPDDLI